MHGNAVLGTILIFFFLNLTNRYQVSHDQADYSEVRKPSKKVSATRLHRKSEEAVYDTIENEGAIYAYSTAVKMQDNPAYQVTGTQPSNDSVHF